MQSKRKARQGQMVMQNLRSVPHQHAVQVLRQLVTLELARVDVTTAYATQLDGVACWLAGMQLVLMFLSVLSSWGKVRQSVCC